MPERARRRNVIAIRLALATVGVAVGAIVLLATLTLIAAVGNADRLAREQQEGTVEAIVAVVSEAYRATGSWNATDLRDVAALAADRRASLAVFDRAGRAVPVPKVSDSGPAELAGPARSAGVTVDGQRVGTIVVHFYAGALPTADRQLRDALIRRVAAAAGLSALLALGVAVMLSRRITEPVVALTDAARVLSAGNRHVRVQHHGADDELGELALAFNRMAETIEREDELRRAVVADVTHELRTPLAIVQGGCEALVEGVAEPTSENLSSLHEEILRLVRTVEDLDTLATAEAATLRMDLRAVDLAEPAARAAQSLAPAFAGVGVHLSALVEAAPATADGHRVEQIVVNLLTNALKFTGAGGTVTLTVGLAEEGAVVEVADTGVGIPADELPHVFERFWRGKNAGRLAGSGIGLAVVRTLVDAQGGTITVCSSPADGTRVRVILPPAPAATPAGRIAARPS